MGGIGAGTSSAGTGICKDDWHGAEKEKHNISRDKPKNRPPVWITCCTLDRGDDYGGKADEGSE